jgi:glycosyltransferase involved in cell wall biosynthesis
MNIAPTDPTPIAPPIQLVPSGTPRPLWSVMIPTFNCAKYLRLTLQSVLAQAPSPEQMQIEVVDDCSTKDDPEIVVRELGEGRVQFYRKPANGGAIANFNTCVERSRGQLVHILHGDDLVLPEFYGRVGALAEKHEGIAGFFVRCLDIGPEGELLYLSTRLTWLEKGSRVVDPMLVTNPIKTPGCVVRRSFYEMHGGFKPAFVHVADWEMWVRVVSEGGGIFINSPLAEYRIFPENDTGRLARTAGNLRDMIQLGREWERSRASFNSREFLNEVSNQAKKQAEHFLMAGDREAAAANWAVFRETSSFKQRVRWLLQRWGLLRS